MVHRPGDKRRGENSLPHWPKKINQHMLFLKKRLFLLTLKYEQDPSSASNSPFKDFVVPPCFGTLYSNQGSHQSEGAHHNGGDHQRTRRLDVTWQHGARLI